MNDSANKSMLDDSVFSSSIPPEFVRLKGRMVKEIEPQDIQSTGVQIQFMILDVIGYGATFSKRLQPKETIIAFTKFGHNSFTKSSLDSLQEGTSFVAEMEGNPIIANQYTIYKLQLTK